MHTDFTATYLLLQNHHKAVSTESIAVLSHVWFCWRRSKGGIPIVLQSQESGVQTVSETGCVELKAGQYFYASFEIYD
ncbi:hypothetical protein Harman_31130 [Haloarcula mannanilytica]|uniref:Uncharacterized protein n=1 Tax=Haloarcula mannanilytica TaxID=2509225 RepID=A0A4C2EKW4_9EURY|nr:hypothetical protein Harman_31130 [Haloarcula mannanilytica]